MKNKKQERMSIIKKVTFAGNWQFLNIFQRFCNFKTACFSKNPLRIFIFSALPKLQAIIDLRSGICIKALSLMNSAINLLFSKIIFFLSLNESPFFISKVFELFSLRVVQWLCHNVHKNHICYGYDAICNIYAK